MTSCQVKEERKSIDMDKFRKEIIEKEKKVSRVLDKKAVDKILEKKHMIYTPDLLEKIKNMPALWDKKNPKYRLTNRNELWLKICEEMIPDFKYMTKSAQREFAQRLIKKWHNTRDSYRKSVRAKKPYVYSNFLTFLDPLMADVTLLSDKNDDDENDDLSFHGTKYEDDDEEYGHEENPETYNEDSRDTKRNAKSEEIFIEADVTPAKLLKSAITTDWDGQNTSFSQNENLLPILTTMLEKESDEDRAFFNSLIPTVKSLSQEDKLEFRLQVLTSLKNLTANQRDPIDFD